MPQELLIMLCSLYSHIYIVSSSFTMAENEHYPSHQDVVQSFWIASYLAGGLG